MPRDEESERAKFPGREGAEELSEDEQATLEEMLVRTKNERLDKDEQALEDALEQHKRNMMRFGERIGFFEHRRNKIRYEVS